MANTCHNCDAHGAEFDCNGLKFCDEFCFREWDLEDQASMDKFAAEYEKQFVKPTELNKQTGGGCEC